MRTSSAWAAGASTRTAASANSTRLHMASDPIPRDSVESSAVRGQLEPYVGTALGAVRCAGLAAVRMRDGLDDRQAEPGAAPAAAFVGAGEALERGLEEVIGEARALVTHVQLDVTVGRAR